MSASKAARAEATVKEPVDRPFVARAKLFANGRSQAVRLPREFRLPGDEVLIHREGQRLILEPVDAKGWPAELWERIDALAVGLDDDWERPSDPVPPPIQRE